MVLALWAATTPDLRAASHPLRVAADGRHLVDADGRPFLYLADTAWQLFHRLTREEAERYLSDRADKGFSVVQAVVLGLEGLDEPNVYGDRGLVGNDPAHPNQRYFAHVDWIVDRAAAHGLTVAMLPTWGDVWHSRQNAPGPKVFDRQNALVYGRLIGRRYRDRPVIFVLGGDRNAETDEDRAIVRAFAAGLRETAPDHLITYHPRGPGRSSDVFHEDTWLDFDMIQSSHTGRGSETGVNVEHDRALKPPKPTLDGEPRYEALIVDFYNRGNDPALRFDDSDVRMAAYRNLLAGAAGHTYGNNNIWQMWTPGRKPELGADTPWYEALDHPGAFQMGHLRRLFESRPWEKLEPALDLLAGPNLPGAGFVRAALASDRSFAFVYSPQGEPVAVDQGRLGAVDVAAWWFDPRYGRAYPIHTGVGTAVQFFTPPSSGRGCDWVLVLDDAARGFGPPGQRSEDVHVMISSGFYGVYAEMAPAFEQATGHRLVTTRGPSMGDSPEAIPARLARGESADVVILDGGAADELGRRGVVRADSKLNLARSLIGMVVRAGATKPDIGSVAAFRSTLLAAKSIAYSDSGSGSYLSTTLIPELGLWDQIAGKCRKVRGPPSGEPVAAVVARGEAEIGFQQVSELVHVPGIAFVGPLPAELQAVTFYSGALTSTATHAEAGAALLRFLASPEAAAVITNAGLMPLSER